MTWSEFASLERECDLPWDSSSFNTGDRVQIDGMGSGGFYLIAEAMVDGNEIRLYGQPIRSHNQELVEVLLDINDRSFRRAWTLKESELVTMSLHDVTMHLASNHEQIAELIKRQREDEAKIDNGLWDNEQPSSRPWF